MIAELNQHSPRRLEKNCETHGGFRPGFPPYLFEPAQLKPAKPNESKPLLRKKHANYKVSTDNSFDVYNRLRGSLDAILSE